MRIDPSDLATFLAIARKVAELPAVAAWLAGCAVILGATLAPVTVSVAPMLAALLTVLVKTAL